MAAAIPSELFEEVRAFGTLTAAETLRLALLRRALLAVDPAAIVDPSGLTAYGACYGCLGLTLPELFEISMLDQLSQALAA